MANGEHTDWAAALWDTVKFILAGLGTVASSACIWIAARYRGDRAMLLRHEQQLAADTKELGEQRAFRELAHKGPIGEAINSEITKLEGEDKHLHRRMSRTRNKLTNLITEVAEIKTDIKWMRQEMQRRKDGDESH